MILCEFFNRFSLVQEWINMNFLQRSEAESKIFKEQLMKINRVEFNNCNNIGKSNDQIISVFQKLPQTNNINISNLNRSETRKPISLDVFEKTNWSSLTFEFGYFNFLLKYFACQCCISKKRYIRINMFNLAEIHMKEKCDILYFKNAISRLEKLQAIILNKEQNSAIERLKKPYIDDIESEMISNSHNKIEEENQLIAYFKERIADQMSSTDRILFDDLNTYLKSMILSKK